MYERGVLHYAKPILWKHFHTKHLGNSTHCWLLELWGKTDVKIICNKIFCVCSCPKTKKYNYLPFIKKMSSMNRWAFVCYVPIDIFIALWWRKRTSKWKINLNFNFQFRSLNQTFFPFLIITCRFYQWQALLVFMLIVKLACLLSTYTMF